MSFREGDNSMKFPKPKKGSGKAARRARKKKLDKHRDLTNRQVLERDGYVCQHCGASAIHGHHVMGRGNSPEHEFESCEKRLSLCNECHYNHHHIGEITRIELIRDLERVLENAKLQCKR